MIVIDDIILYRGAFFMWDRKGIKADAKLELKQSYWLSFAVCLVATIISGGVNFTTNFGGGTGTAVTEVTDTFLGGTINPMILFAAIAVLGVILIVAVVIGLAFTFFIINPIVTGQHNFFISAANGNREFAHLFSAFKSGRYISIVKVMFFRDLFIFLWSLLLVIPGIIKYYQYRMVPYILNEDPSLSYKEVLQLSRQMTDGEKWNIFVLDLSFLGWYLLGLMACFIGVLFVSPYYHATFAQLYFRLKEKISSDSGTNIN